MDNVKVEVGIFDLSPEDYEVFKKLESEFSGMRRAFEKSSKPVLVLPMVENAKDDIN